MTDALRPSTLGEILDRTANMYRARFLAFLGIACMPASVILACAAVMVLFFTWAATRGDAAGPVVVGLASIVFLIVGLVILLPLCTFAAGLGAGALNYAAAAAFEGQSFTIRGAYQTAWKRGWRYIWLLVLEGLILVVAPGVAWAILIFVFAIGQIMTGKASAASSAAAGGVVMLFLAATGLYAVLMLLMLCLSFPVCVVENVGAWTAVKRAVSLSKGTRGRILVLYILGMVLRWGVSMVLMIPAILIVALVPGLDTPQHAQFIGTVMLLLIYGGSFLVRSLTKPIYTIAQMLFYYDQRIRKEGFDIEWLMRQAGMVRAPAPVPEPEPWMAPVHARLSATLAPPQTAEAIVAPPATAAGAPDGSSPPLSAVNELDLQTRLDGSPPEALPAVPGEPA
jgi:hypothetical protein